MLKGIGKVFISHTSTDKPFVDKLVSDFAKHSIPVWYDKLDIKIGDSIPGKINEGISNSKYFIIVLSANSVTSKWVTEELNAALVKQIASNGTFLLPVLLEDCAIPPLLSHRHHADFRNNYEEGLETLLGAWGMDSKAISQVGSKPLYPFPDGNGHSDNFVYLHSTRFDKFFKMPADLSWSANKALDYIIETLKLPWSKEVPELGMRWSFSYGLVYDEKTITLNKTLSEGGVILGGIIRLNISGTYEDLYEKELKDMWDGSKMYEMGGAMMRDAALKKGIKDRGRLTRDRLREMANSCFRHM